MANITLAARVPRVVAIVERMTGNVQQIADAKLCADGLSAKARCQVVGPHNDTSRDSARQNCRTLNLLCCATPGTTLENGGHLEIRESEVMRQTTIVSRFNRLAKTETLSAWPEPKTRCDVAWADGGLRQSVHRVVPCGLGRTDVHEGPPR